MTSLSLNFVSLVFGVGSSFSFETPPLTGLGIESDSIDEGCQRTRRERQGRLREVT
jgi:hypothetical protein